VLNYCISTLQIHLPCTELKQPFNLAHKTIQPKIRIKRIKQKRLSK
jgi:hypothetical protein